MTIDVATQGDAFFKRLSLGESLQRTVEVYRKGFVTFTQISLLVVGSSAVVWALMLLVLMPAFGVDGDTFVDPNQALEHMGIFWCLMGIRMLVAILVGAIGNGAMIRVVAHIYVQKEPTFSDCLRVGIRYACSILTAAFLGCLGVGLGFMLLFAPGLWLCVKWFVVNPAIVIEGLGAIAAFKRSSELVAGNWCYVFCTFLIAYIIMIVLQIIWSTLFAGGNDASHTMFSFGGSIVSAVPGIVFAPILATMITVMYINLRVEKEGLNANLLARNLGETAGEAAYSALLDEEQDGGNSNYKAPVGETV